jgi:hypothetical protein
MCRILARLPIGPSDRGHNSNSYRQDALFNSVHGQDEDRAAAYTGRCCKYLIRCGNDSGQIGPYRGWPQFLHFSQLLLRAVSRLLSISLKL